jgi:hypothetical protein
MSFAAEFPDLYANMAREVRDTRAVTVGSDEAFLWGLWVCVREEVFDQIEDCWERQGREQCRGPFRGRLANSLAEYPETLNLKTKILVQPLGTRPCL